MSGFWRSETMAGRLGDVVAPFDSTHIVNCSYELSLGDEIFLTSAGSNTKQLLGQGEQIEIPQGHFANLVTHEKVTIPNDAIGLISIKFSFKQSGLVNVSGFHVDPGYSGKLVFSVYNAGPVSAFITQGEPIFLLWLCALDGPTGDLYTKSGRTGITDSDVMKLQGEIATPQAIAKRISDLEDRLKNWTWVWNTLVVALLGAILAAIVGIGVSYLVSSSSSTQAPPTSTTTTTTTTTAGT
jgi:dCTP deaminase